MGKFLKFFPLALIGIFFLVFLIVPQVAHGEVSLWPTGFWATDGLVPPQCQEQSCQSLCDLMDLGQRVVYFALTILLFIIVPIMVMWGGLTILTSGGASTILEGGKTGSPAGISKGKKILTGAVIGAAIGVGSFLIINTFIWGLGLIAGQGQGSIGWGTVVCTPPPMPSSGGVGTGNNGTGNNGTGNDGTGTGQLPGGNNNSGCPNCKNIDFDNFVFGNSNRGVNPKMYDLLEQLSRSSYYTFRVTEAFPPTVQHSDPKHNNGCAIDVTAEDRYKDPTNPNHCTVVQGMIDAARRVGLTVKNEDLACGGSPSSLSTAPHLHINAPNCP